MLSSPGLSNGRKARASLQDSQLAGMLVLSSAGSPLERNKVLLSAGYYIRALEEREAIASLFRTGSDVRDFLCRIHCKESERYFFQDSPLEGS